MIIHDTENRSNIRYRLLAFMPKDHGSCGKIRFFHTADSIASWHHAVIGRFRHLCACTRLLEGQDRYAVLSVLGIAPELCCHLLGNDSSMNIPDSKRTDIIRATGELMTSVLRVKKENCLVFQPASPYLPRTSRPYSECQVRNLLLYYTLERREEFSQSIGSVTAAVADTIYAYQQLCLSISTIDDINVRQEALRLTGVEPAKFRQTLDMLYPFYCLDGGRNADQYQQEPS